MIVDVNVSLARWPFRRVPCDEPPRLVETLSAAEFRRLGPARWTVCSIAIWAARMPAWRTSAADMVPVCWCLLGP